MSTSPEEICCETSSSFAISASIVSNTATSTFFVALVRMCGPRNDWSLSTPMPQTFLGPHILTSATKKVDVAVFDTIEALTKDSLEGGGDTLYDVANGGVGYGKVSPDAPDRDALIAKLDDVSQQISSGVVDIPRT